MERTLRAYVWPAVAYCVILELMLLAAIEFWPEFKENVGPLQAMLKFGRFPELLERVGGGGLEGYVDFQQFFKGCNGLGTAAAILFAMGAVAGEANRGTLEIWLARPFSRRRMLLERWGAGALALCLPIFLTSATIPPLVERFGETVRWSHLLLASTHSSVFLLCIYSLTFFCSTISSQPARLALIFLFVTTLQFAIYFVKVVSQWSVYRLADIEVCADISRTLSLDWSLVAPMLGGIALLVCASLFTFSRRVP